VQKVSGANRSLVINSLGSWSLARFSFYSRFYRKSIFKQSLEMVRPQFWTWF